jgi:hypothetical protein
VSFNYIFMQYCNKNNKNKKILLINLISFEYLIKATAFIKLIYFVEIAKKDSIQKGLVF